MLRTPDAGLPDSGRFGSVSTMTATDRDERRRIRLRWTLFAAVGVMTTGYLAALTVSPLAARDITGSPTLAGLPSAVAVVSTAVGTTLLGRIVVASGRRRSLVTGAAVSALGAAVATLGVFLSSLPVLLAGMALFGLGYAASHLSRYAAADLVVAQRRGRAVSLVVWAGTIGAVVGPRLIGPAGVVADGLGGATYAGGFLVAMVAMAMATIVLMALRPDPSTLAVADPADPGDHAGAEGSSGWTGAGAWTSLPGVSLAIVGMVLGQFVMVLVMTATPIHVEDHGFDLGVVGGVISAHTLGMFAFAPLVGRVVDRVGPRRTLAASAVVLGVSTVVSAAAPVQDVTILTVGLFLLGLGWNLSFVAGSTLLSVSVPAGIRPVVQGRVDSLVWVTSAVASFGSGLLLAGPGYRATAILATLLVVPVLVAAVRTRWRSRHEVVARHVA